MRGCQPLCSAIIRYTRAACLKAVAAQIHCDVDPKIRRSDRQPLSIAVPQKDVRFSLFRTETQQAASGPLPALIASDRLCCMIWPMAELRLKQA